MHLPKIDKYAHIPSFFTHWDPRVKILSLGLLSFSYATLTDLLSLFLAFLSSLFFLLLSKIPFRFVLKQLRWAILFTSLLFVALSLSLPKDLEGARLGILIGMRAMSICVLLFLICATAPVHITLKAFGSLKVPNVFIQLLLFAYRYIFILVEEANQISKAASSRCLGKKTAPSTYKAIGNIVGMLFVRGLERAQGIYNAMVARGYNGALNLQIEQRPSSLDLIKASLFVFFASLFHLRRLFL